MESYLYARDNFLKPGGKMIPSSGNIHLAPFTDSILWANTMENVCFWDQDNFYGVNLKPLQQTSKKEIFAQPVVGPFDHKILLANHTSFHRNKHLMDNYLILYYS